MDRKIENEDPSWRLKHRLIVKFERKSPLGDLGIDGS
jgi:hypothetical protein